MQTNNTLAILTEEQLADLYDWICADGILQAQKRLAQPSPHGFGLNAHRNTLSRFFHDHSRRDHRQDLVEIESMPVNPADESRLLSSAQTILAHTAYRLSFTAAAPQVFNQLSRTLHRHRIADLKEAFLHVAQQQLDIARQRLALQRDFLAEKKRQFNFNAAKQAALHALKIKTVLADKTIDLEAKVWKVNDIVFGPPPPETDPSPTATSNQ